MMFPKVWSIRLRRIFTLTQPVRISGVVYNILFLQLDLFKISYDHGLYIFLSSFQQHSNALKLSRIEHMYNMTNTLIIYKKIHGISSKNLSHFYSYNQICLKYHTNIDCILCSCIVVLLPLFIIYIIYNIHLV